MTKWRSKPSAAAPERSEELQPGVRRETAVPAGAATQLHCAELRFPRQSMARVPQWPLAPEAEENKQKEKVLLPTLRNAREGTVSVVSHAGVQLDETS